MGVTKLQDQKRVELSQMKDRESYKLRIIVRKDQLPHISQIYVEICKQKSCVVNDIICRSIAINFIATKTDPESVFSEIKSIHITINQLHIANSKINYNISFAIPAFSVPAAAVKLLDLIESGEINEDNLASEIEVFLSGLKHLMRFISNEFLSTRI